MQDYRQELRKTVPGLLAERKFKELDALADALRASQARVVTGSLKLTQFYVVVAELPAKPKDEVYEERIKLLENWVDERPESFTGLVTLARTWEQYGWFARGGGYANTLSREGVAHFEERCLKAADLLQQAEQLPVKDPELYHFGIMLGIDLSWSREIIERICDDSATLDPGFLPTFIAATRYYLPRWYGDAGDLEEFAKEAVQKTEKACGKTIYARIVLAAEDYHSFTAFNDFAFDWSLVKQGFEDWNRQYPPDQRRLQSYCRLACVARDRQTAGALFEKIEPPGLDAVWISSSTYRFFRRWAKPNFAKGQQRQTIEKICVPINGLAWGSDQWLLVAESSGPISAIDVATGLRVVFEEKWPVSFAICFDRDSDVIYASGYGGRVWKFEPAATLLGKHGGDVTSIALERGGKTLITAGRGSSVKLWNIAEPGKPEQFKTDGKRVPSIDVDREHNLLVAGIDTGTATLWSLNRRTAIASWKAHDASVNAVAFSPDGKLLATAGPKEVKLWNPGDQQFVATLEGASDVFDLEFTSDGKKLVGGTGNLEKNGPGVVAVWDVPGRRLLKKMAGHKGAITSVAISADGQTIATGSWDTSIRL
ncbi:MAG TPA: WD40 repeat domain-containing protein, partial [Pirellulales bacterium]|nr:WD40 repeat domain-containing protein [Pirellulales bacterium]